MLKARELLNNIQTSLDNIGSTVKSRTLTELFNLQKEVLSENPPVQKVAASVTAIKDIDTVSAEASSEAGVALYEKFWQAYLSPNGKMDVTFRLGEVLGVKSIICADKFTDNMGQMYTRCQFRNELSYADHCTDPGRQTTDHYTQLWFPPYAFDGKVEPVAVNQVSARPTGGAPVQSTNYNIKDFKVLRSNLTYRKPGFKSVNDHIQYLQFLKEGLTGIVSTYLTEWDLSVYMQEGIIAAQDVKDSSKIPTITLTYRITEDNPAGYTTKKDACTFGVVNACLSKQTYKLEWPISKFPYSCFWIRPTTPLYSGSTCTLTTADRQLPRTADTTLLDYFRDMAYIDKWNAIAAQWTDWSTPYYKALYPDDSDGLSDADTDYFMGDDEVNTASTIVNETDDDSGDGWKSACKSGYSSKKKYGSGGSVVTKANEYATAKTMQNVSAGSPTFITPVGMPVRNPVLYGGPHGRDVSPKHPLSMLDVQSELLRNYPRANCDSLADMLKTTNTDARKSGVNIFYKYHTKTQEQSSNDFTKAQFQKHLAWEEAGEDSGTGTITVGQETSEDAGDSRENVDFSPYDTIAFAKQGSHEVRNFYGNYAYKHYEKQIVKTARNEMNQSNLWVDDSGTFDLSTNMYPSGYPNLSLPKTKRVYNCITGQWEDSAITYTGAPRNYSYTAIVRVAHYDPDENGSYYSGYTNYYYTTEVVRYYVVECDGYYTDYSREMCDKYMAHAMPYTRWQIVPFWAVSGDPGVQTSWDRIAAVIANWGRSAASTNTTISSLVCWQARARFTTPYSSVARYDSTPSDQGKGEPFNMTVHSDEVEIMNKMVKNARGISANNYIYLVGNGDPADFIVRACMGRREFTKHTYRTHSHRCHSCHSHHSWTHFEYIDVDLSQLGHGLQLLNLSSVKKDVPSGSIFDTLGSDMFKSCPGSKISILGSAGAGSQQVVLEGQGLLSDIPGVDPVAKTTNTHNADLIKANSNELEIFGAYQFPCYKLSSYNTSSFTSPNQQTCYAESESLENYVQQGNLPDRIRKAIINAYTTATFYPMNSATPQRVSLAYPVYLLWAQLNYHFAVLPLVRDVLTLLDQKSLQYIVDNWIDPKTTTVCQPGQDLSSLSKKADFNYWYNQALSTLATFDATKDSMLADLNKYSQAIQRGILLLEPLVSKTIDNWSWSQLKQAYTVMNEVMTQVNLVWSFNRAFDMYLQIEYEYRKYFASKRFNKADGTAYMLRHLEVLSLVAQTSLAVTTPSKYKKDSSNRPLELEVAKVEFQNTTAAKASALVDSTTALSTDRIIKVYIEVEYPKTAVSTDAEKAAYEKKYNCTLVKTSLTTDSEFYDPTHVYAIQPSPNKYQLISREWTRNENARTILNAKKKVEGADLSTPVVYDYPKVITPIQEWVDAVGKNPIVRGNVTGISSSASKDYKQTAGDSASALGELCYSKLTTDYWTVDLQVATQASPNATGYRNQLQLVAVKADDASPIDSAAVAATGWAAGQLWPITEEQATSGQTTQDSLDSMQQQVADTLKNIKLE